MAIEARTSSLANLDLHSGDTSGCLHIPTRSPLLKFQKNVYGYWQMIQALTVRQKTIKSIIVA